ncbi:hypothetical protein [Glaciecola sp. SC05]|uniref:hypothetical protein n=1 Tax=Glaciecola sp. SC05 TaxID=1987355 RepID=UPI0035279C91
MNKLINIVLSGLLWRKYKFLLVSLIALIAFVFLVGQIHQDYLSYAQSTANASVGLSFAVKWLVWAVAIFVFLGANHWVNKRKQKQSDLEEKNSALQRIINWKNRNKLNSTEAPAKQPSEERSKASEDPFAELRTKDKLRTYADLIIEKKNQD